MSWIVWELHLLYGAQQTGHNWISQHQLVPDALVHHLTQLLKSKIRVPVGAVHYYLLTLQGGLLPLQFPDDLWPSLRWRLSAIGGPSRPVYRYADVHFFTKMTRQVTYSLLFLNNKYVELARLRLAYIRFILLERIAPFNITFLGVREFISIPR
jgi:hypothetical protein